MAKRLTPAENILRRCQSYKSYNASISFHNVGRGTKTVMMLTVAQYAAKRPEVTVRWVQWCKEQKLMKMLVNG